MSSFHLFIYVYIIVYTGCFLYLLSPSYNLLVFVFHCDPYLLFDQLADFKNWLGQRLGRVKGSLIEPHGLIVLNRMTQLYNAVSIQFFIDIKSE
jgi:hypothetical protein